MAIKLGNTDINKLYLGSTEVQKVYLGNNLILDNSTPSFINLNSTFDDDSDLTYEAAWSISGGTANYNRSSNHDLIFHLSEDIQTGDSLSITFDIINPTLAGARAVIYAGSGTNGEVIQGTTIYDTADTYTVNHTLTSTSATNRITILGTNNASGGQFSIDNVQIIKN